MMVAPTDLGGAPARADPAGLTSRQPGAIAHALEALEAVAHLGAGATAQQISQRLGLSPATTYRLLNLLVAEEYIVRLPELSGFALGRRALEFAGLAAPRFSLSRQARRAMSRLRDDVRWGVHLAVYAGGRAHIVDADPDHPPQHAVVTEFAVDRSALGRLLTAPASDESAAVTVDRGEVDAGTAYVAAAIRDENGHVMAALVVVGPLERVREVEADLIGRLTSAAIELGDLLA